MRRIIDDPSVIREEIFKKVVEGIKNKFPIESNNYIADISNINVKHTHIPYNKQKIALMSKGNLSDGVYVDLVVKDKKNNKVVGKLTNYKLMNIPYFTERYTFIIDGNEYSIVNQLRTKSGVYTRKRGNDELESSFNLKKGANFKLIMDPETGVFKINILHSTIPAYFFLKILGADDTIIKSTLGENLFLANRNMSETQYNKAIDTLFTKLVSYKTKEEASVKSKEEKIKAIRDYFSGTEIDGETTKITLGESFTNVNWKTILAAMSKMLRVYNEEDDVDERDNLEFQKIYTAEDIIKEVLDKNNSEITKIKYKLDSYTPTNNDKENEASLKQIFSPAYFTKPIKNFITTSSIARLPQQINPMEIMDTVATVTRLGEGAISSEQAVPDETRGINYSYMGVIDPIATPESSKIGIDNRVTIGAIKGDDNELYNEVHNVKTNKIEKVRIIDLRDKKVGFPLTEQEKKEGIKPNTIVPAIYQGKLVKIKASELDYRIPTPSHLMTTTTNTIPFVNANQANRIVMGAKHVQQALPLKEPDKRLVKSKLTVGEDGSIEDIVGKFTLPKAPVDGKVTKIDQDFIYIKDNTGAVHKVEYAENFPLATKTMLHNKLTVSVGDEVKKGQPLGDSLYTKDGTLSLGKNLTVAYTAYHGLNHEDGIIISESAAKKLTSVHSDKIVVTVDKNNVLSKEKYAMYFPTKFTKEQLSKLDDKGVVKKGTILNHGDPIVVMLEDNAESHINKVLGKLHKSLIQKYRDVSEVYEEDKPAEVVDVHQSGKIITVLLKIEKPIQIGDKISGSYGNKGVVVKILPDDQILQTKDGKPVDVIYTSAGVIGRINPSQILETALGKVAAKTGKTYNIANFSEKNYIDFVKSELKKHNVSDKEDLIDPITGKVIPNIMTGVQHVYKLFKTTDTNYSARNVEGPHDTDEAPTGSGEIGPKALGGMEVNALLAHNARNLLKESTIIRASKNADFWRNFKYGMITHFPTEKKTFNKFISILKQAGVNVERKDNKLIAGPLTDNDILSMSNGEITDGKRLDFKLNPEHGGLFDPKITGGLEGENWAHIKLAEPVVNPVFEDCVKALLDMDTKTFNSTLEEKGAQYLKDELNKIDLDKLEKELTEELDSLKGDKLDKAVKKLKYIKALKAKGLKAGDAYILSYVPVTPPKIRPIAIGKTGDLLESDANHLYKELILHNNSFKEIKKELPLESEIRKNRIELYNKVKELTGIVSSNSPHLKNRNVKGAIEYIAGSQPKEGYFQRKVIYSKMNLTGRATIAPDVSLGLDEVGMPEDMAWSMYKPFIIRELTKNGYSAIQAKEEVENKSEKAKQVLLSEMEKRPIIINRAPSLWRYSVISAKPVLRPGKTLYINTLWESGLNSDFDGDAMQVHLPITDEAIEDAKKMMPSRLIYSDKKKGDLLYAPKMEPVVGLYKATTTIGQKPPSNKKVPEFNTLKDAWAAYYKGEIKATDFIIIKNTNVK